MPHIFFKSAVENTILSVIICRGGSIRARDFKKFKQTDKESWSCSGRSGDDGEKKVSQRMKTMDNPEHPLLD